MKSRRLDSVADVKRECERPHRIRCVPQALLHLEAHDAPGKRPVGQCEIGVS
jgi:hypothetical protein